MAKAVPIAGTDFMDVRRSGMTSLSQATIRELPLARRPSCVRPMQRVLMRARHLPEIEPRGVQKSERAPVLGRRFRSFLTLGRPVLANPIK
jgi:hypothetical protein